MVQIHDRYSKTFELMLEELAVSNWRALTELNVENYVQPRPGVFMLAHSSPHDMNRTKPPYHFGKAEDLQAELTAQVHPDDPELKTHELRGERWFRLEYCDAGELDARLAALREKWAEYKDPHGVTGEGAHAPVGLERHGDSGGQHN